MKSPLEQLGPSVRRPSVSSVSLPGTSLLVSVSFPGRNRVQQWKDMEGDPALLPHDLAEFRDGEEKH